MNIDYVFPKCSITFKGLIHDFAALSKKNVHKLSNIRLALLFLCFFSILFSAHIGSCTTLSADGSWSNIIGGEQVVIDPPNEVRWGEPVSDSQKSGLRFDGYSGISVPIGENFCIGELTHLNYPIYPSAATQATLSVTLQFVDPAITSTFSFDLGIDETLNVGSCGDCSYEPCELPCPDMISILSVPGPQTFSVNGKSYKIEILGFTETCPGGDPEQEVITQENRATTIYLVGRLQELGADLSITKTDSPDPVMAGGLLTYALTVTNNGPSEASGVQLADNLPASYLANAEYRVESGSWLPYASGQSIALGNLAAGASTNIEIRGTVSADAPDETLLTNSADVSSQTPDSNAENNRAQAETTVRNIPQADLSVTKTDSPDPVMAGGLLTYALTVTNNGPSEATGVQLTDNLPASYLANAEYRVESGSWLSYASGQAIALGNLAAGASTNIEIRGTVSADATDETTLSNTAYVASQTFDPNMENNQAEAQTAVNIPKADLSLEKEASPDPVMPGSLLTYVLTVTNGGPSDATGIQLTDASAPDYLDNIEYRIGSDTWSPFPTGQSISLGDLANGENIIIEIRGTVPADTIEGTTLSNTAFVASQIFDPNMVNNQAEAQTLVGPIKPSPQESVLPTLKKKASSSTVAPGGIITYTIDFTCPQQDAVIQEKYPMGVSFISSSPPPDSGTNDRWTFNGQSSGTIIVAVRAPHDPNIIFHLEQKAGGVGFMRAYKDLSTGREALVMVNTVVMTYTENSVSGSLSAESAVAVSGGAGTETALRESGSGEYSSEELLNYYRCNRSIRDTSNLSASYQPSSFKLPGGRTVNYSSKWASADTSKNYLTSESIESQYLLAGKIDKESDIHLDRNGTKISTDSEFEGMYQSEYQKLAEPDSKGHRSVEKELGATYSGSFKIKERLATTFSKRPNAITSVKHYDEPHVTVYQRSEQDRTNENNLNYTISILNDGNRALGPIRVSDIFPAGTYFLDSSTRPTEPRIEDLSESRYANWTFAHLPLGQAVTIYLRVIRYVVLDVPINAVYVSAGYDGQWFNASNITATNSNWLSCTPQGICTRSQSGGWNPPNWGFDLTEDICSFCPSGLINVADDQSDCPECTL